MKHCSKDNEVEDVEVDNLLLPAPNLNGGNWDSKFRVGSVFVEYPFALDSEGRSKAGFLLLVAKVNECLLGLKSGVLLYAIWFGSFQKCWPRRGRGDCDFGGSVTWGWRLDLHLSKIRLLVRQGRDVHPFMQWSRGR